MWWPRTIFWTGTPRSGRRCRPDEVAAVRVVVESPNSSLATPAVSDHGAAVDCAEVDTGRVVRPVLVLNRLALSPVVAVEDGDSSVVREAPVPSTHGDIGEFLVRPAASIRSTVRHVRQVTKGSGAPLPPLDPGHIPEFSCVGGIPSVPPGFGRPEWIVHHCLPGRDTGHGKFAGRGCR